MEEASDLLGSLSLHLHASGELFQNGLLPWLQGLSEEAPGVGTLLKAAVCIQSAVAATNAAAGATNYQSSHHAAENLQETSTAQKTGVVVCSSPDP